MLARPLQGRHIVITRPSGQASHLAETLAELGARPVLFPVLEIVPLDDPAPLVDFALHLDNYDWAVFVSPNAVEQALKVICAHRPWPERVCVATVGGSSQRALARFGIRRAIAPQNRFDSEALLSMAELQSVVGQRIVIFRGDGGRELLGDTLGQRGARVDYVCCYHRSRPRISPASLLNLWNDGCIDAVTVTSSEGMRNLYEMVGKLGQSWLRNTPTFVPHPRIAEQAAALGLRRVCPTGPADDGLVAGLLEFFREHADIT